MEKTNLSSSIHKGKIKHCGITRKSLKKRTMNIAFHFCVCVCFVEEVILADDENENDYDGIYAHKCDFSFVYNLCLY